MHIKSLGKPNDIILHEESKKKRNQLISDLRNSEIEYYSNQLELHKSDLSKCWKILRSIIGKGNNNSKRKTCFTVNNVTTNDSKVIADAFNSYFVSVGPQLASNMTTTNINPMTYSNTT